MSRIIIQLLFILIICISYQSKEKPAETGKVTVTGRVHLSDGQNTNLLLIYSQPGLKRVQIPIDPDGMGRFMFEFESSIPLDAMILDKKSFANINFIYHPTDSIHVEFTAKDSQLSLLRTVEFTGDRAKSNNDLMVFQRLREERKLGYSAIDPSVSYQKDLDDFIRQMDSVKQKQLILFNQFIDNYSPTKEVEEWAKLFALQSYYSHLDEYASSQQNLPDYYHSYNQDILPLSSEKLIGWSILAPRIASYWTSNIGKDLYQEFADKIEEINKGEIDADSLLIRYITTHIEDKLLLELLVANYYTTQLEANIIDGYQKNQYRLDTMITLPIIKENLNKSYRVAYNFLNKENEYAHEHLITMEETPVGEVFSRILSENEGGIVYIDCWATWCGPCIKAMPDSKNLMAKYKDKNVSFVYLCLSSPEKLWRRMVSEFNLGGGQHYFLNQEQSEFFAKTMNAQSLPEYFLIDQEKNIVEKGNHLHPGGKLIEQKMNELLD